MIYISPEGIKTYAVSEPLTDEEAKALIRERKRQNGLNGSANTAHTSSSAIRANHKNRKSPF
jgi:hypothetical protein